MAANSGLPAPPGWYFNLTANPWARVEVGGRTLAVRAEELSAEEAAAFWPQILQAAPDYARYLRRTSRRIPLLRLIPATWTMASGTTSRPSAIGEGDDGLRCGVDCRGANLAVRGFWSAGGRRRAEVMREPLAGPMQQRSGIVSGAVG